MKKHFILAFCTIASLIVVTQGVATAAPINYNNIIDNNVFDNYNTMNAAQIDAFLNTFPNSCLSTNNGFTAPDVIGYNPTSSFQYGGLVSAGTIIHNASQAFSINPQVLLTTLQKEQGLVKGDGPNIVRSGPDSKNCGALVISASVGYNCPDGLHLSDYSGITLYAYRGTPVTSVSQTCVESASYVGFSRQVVIAAWQFTFDRHRSEGQNNWYANKPNWDNSDDLFFCYSHRTVAGGPFYLCPDKAGHSSDPYISHSGQYPIDDIVVRIENGATAALYNYTPHKHGQMLFTDIFTGWFGLPYGNDTTSQHPNGTVIAFNGTVYLLENSTRRPVTAAVFNLYGYSWSQVKPASSGDKVLAEGPLLSILPTGKVFTIGDGTVYVTSLSDGVLKKQWISSSTFSALDYKWSQIVRVPANAAPAETIPGYYTADKHPAGTLIKMNGGIYITEDTGTRYLSLVAFNSYKYNFESVIEAAPGDKLLSVGAPAPIRQGTILLASGNIYIVDVDASGSYKRNIGPWECYADRLHYTSSDWLVTSVGGLPVRTGSLFTC